ncbi:tripartite tricarboxylate transporter TctB family protein [Pseudonocardia spinosispora]|uniref:tripartite tricarboxylate transporter TctB family protein n=1 Tax=Pseudonocardia spinosispora TaxID=103441 RepID=UPI0003FA4411|nr:tripartite tricarboxylate transporter TctB family protein [Pseudonocardia spinosispora]
MRITEIVLGVVVAALGVGALTAAVGLDRFGAHGVPGPGFFPDLLAVLLIVLGLLLALVSLRARTTGPAIEPATEDRFEVAGAVRAGRVWLGFVVSIPLLLVIGFVPAMVALVAYLAFGVERIRGLRPLLASVLIPLGVYLLFVYLLGVDLPGPALPGSS